MTDERWFERAESRWGSLWSDVWTVLVTAARLVARSPQDMLLAVALQLLAIKIVRLIPYQDLDGVALHTSAWGSSWLLAMLSLIVLVALAWRGYSHLRGEQCPFPKGLAFRVRQALPYGLVLYLLKGYLVPLLYWGGRELVETAIGLNNVYVWKALTYVSAFPLFLAVALFGVGLIGASVGYSVSWRRSFEMSRGKLGPLLLTAFLWWVASHEPFEWHLFISDVPPWFMDVFFNWLSKPLRFAVNVYFYLVAVVWFQRLKERAEFDCAC